MWGYLSTVLGVYVVFNLIAFAIRFALRAPSDVVTAAALSTILYIGAAVLIFTPPAPEASAEPVAVHKQNTPVATSTPLGQPRATPPAELIAKSEPSSPPAVSREIPAPEPVKKAPAPPVDPRWQYQRYRIGTESEKPTDKPQGIVTIEQPERRSLYSRYAVPADRITTQSGKPKALFVIHAGTDSWSTPFYPSKYRYHFEATGNVLVRVNGKDPATDLATLNQSGGDVQSLSFKASGSNPITIYVYPAQP